MCGIVGIAGRAPVDREALASATAALRHRGPDGDAVYVDASGRVGFGHTRLAIIDLSPAGAQPMVSRDGRYVITYNGEIYNFHTLRDELAARGARWRGHSDTEVLLEGFAAFGPAVLDRLNGIFALAIHDTVSGEVFLARDQMGVKPLYYAETAAGVVFASEIKALGQLMDEPGAIDASAIGKYLTFLWCPGEQTPLKSVRKLEPGAAMTVRDGKITRRWTYWTPPAYAPRRDWSADRCAEELRALVEACVERQMLSDAPLGAFLSGGLDSSAIVAAARRKAPGLECFTIDTGEVEGGTTSDLPYARAVARHLDVKLHEVRVDAHTMADRVPDMVRILDEPLADPACLNVLFISQLARDHGIKVLLSGAGGDDLFTGYRRHTMLAFDPVWGAIPGPLRRGLASASGRLGQGSTAGRRMAKMFAAAAEPADRRIETAFAWGAPGIARELMAPDLRGAAEDSEVYAPLDAVMAETRGEPAVERCLALEKRFFLADHNLTYTDKMGMAAGVEARVPLLDLELMRFAATVPAAWKHRGLTPKWIFKRSQRGILPDHVINRPKTGFGAPLRLWMKRELRDLTEELLSPRTIGARGLFDVAAVTRLREADAAGRSDGAYTLFSLMCVELWCREFLDGAATRTTRSNIAPQASVAVGSA
jgi:asparagine synthase (glutamine-hydrolysing)